MPPLSFKNNLKFLRVDHDPECSSPEADQQERGLLCTQYCVYFVPSWELGKGGLIRQIEMSGETCISEILNLTVVVLVLMNFFLTYKLQSMHMYPLLCCLCAILVPFCHINPKVLLCWFCLSSVVCKNAFPKYSLKKRVALKVLLMKDLTQDQTVSNMTPTHFPQGICYANTPGSANRSFKTLKIIQILL